MTGITSLLNDTSLETANKKVAFIELEEIERNPLNLAPIENIDELVELIKLQGLINPIVIYKVKNHQYRLIAGERRLTACKQIGMEEIPAIIVDKPNSEVMERLMILDANAQRSEDNKEYKRKRAEEYGMIHDLLKAEGKIEKGTLRQDWIGVHMNVSGRTVSRYLNEETATEDAPSSPGTPQKEKKVKQKTLSSACKKLEKLSEKIAFTSLDELETEDILQSATSIKYCLQLIEDINTNLEAQRKKIYKL